MLPSAASERRNNLLRLLESEERETKRPCLYQSKLCYMLEDFSRYLPCTLFQINILKFIHFVYVYKLRFWLSSL